MRLARRGFMVDLFLFGIDARKRSRSYGFLPNVIGVDCYYPDGGFMLFPIYSV